MVLLVLQSNGQFHLLFLAICLMTSGHFLSSIDDQQHHSNRRYQQQQQQQQQEQEQEQYHHPSIHPTIIPAVSRPHLLPSHDRIIIRRASSSQQQQHSASAKDHSITPTLTLLKKIDILQIDDELKALKKKRKRLRQLREEVRELSDHLKNKRTFPKTIKSNNDMLVKYKMKKANVRWRKQITTRVKGILKRLKRLENELKTERNFTKERKKMAKHLPLLLLNVDPIQSSTQTLPNGNANKNFKIKRLHSSINQSKNGDPGGICFSHNDCKPGLCCQHTFAMDVNSSITLGTSVCYHYMLKEGELCEDSCQCEARLHCFQNSNHLKVDTSMTKFKRNLYAICKKVSTGDIVNGTYLNSRNSSFYVESPLMHQL